MSSLLQYYSSSSGSVSMVDIMCEHQQKVRAYMDVLHEDGFDLGLPNSTPQRVKEVLVELAIVEMEITRIQGCMGIILKSIPNNEAKMDKRSNSEPIFLNRTSDKNIGNLSPANHNVISLPTSATKAQNVMTRVIKKGSQKLIQFGTSKSTHMKEIPPSPKRNNLQLSVREIILGRNQSENSWLETTGLPSPYTPKFS